MGDEDETEYDAQIVGYDLETDLAVLKIDATGLTPAEFGNSDDLRVGELVIAIGNPLGFELQNTVTCGIVSALNREVTINEKDMTLIQTDAAINSGNSGGPLLNAYGQVVGINSAKMSSTYGSSNASIEGLGFAIPISDAKDIIEDLINNGHVTGRPQFGITGVTVTESDAQHYNMPQGVYVYSVTDGSAAYEAGIRQGDVIIAVEGEEIKDMDSLNEAKNKHNAGDTIKITIFRAGEEITVDLTLQEVQQED
jgi:serine protease Do